MEQINMFEEVEYKITKPIRLIELFGGVGSQAMALRNIGVSFEHHRLVEFDKFAIKSYNAIHGTDFPTVDITEVKGKDLGITDTDKYEYMMTYSFPCQDLSVAGKGKGMSRDSGTRSGLLWEVERLLDETEQLPQILLMENVPQVISKKNKADFDELLQFLESKGYSNFYEKLNAKNFGVAQNRDRVFMISILGDYTYVFPKGIELTKTVKDYLEDEVDEKFYINTDKAKQLISKIDDKYKVGQSAIKVSKQCGKFDGVTNISSTLLARDYKGFGNQSMVGVLEPVIVAQRGRNPENPSDRTVGSPTEQRLEPNQKGLCNTLTTVQKDNLVLEPAVLTPKRTEYGKSIRKDYESGKIQESRHNMTELQPREDGISNTLTTVQKDNLVLEPMIIDDTYANRPIRQYRNWSPTLRARNSGFKLVEPKVAVKQATKKGYIECKVGGVADLSYPNSKLRRGRVQHGGDVSPTLTAGSSGVSVIENTDYRIRKLTPKECWRLMGFTDEDFHKAESVCSNTQLYKQAGNSIVVPVLEAIFKQLL